MKTHPLSALVFSLFLFTAGCTSTKPYVRKEASKDLQCSEEKIKVTDDGIYWHAEGCEKTAEYKCGGCAFGPPRCTQVYK
jgi:hypothetical protein